MNTKILLGIMALFFIGASGCLTAFSPLNETWETKVLGFTQTLNFESNGTGVLVTTLGNQSNAYEIIDEDTLRYRLTGDAAWETREYVLVNNNTLEFMGLTWVRKGSV